MDIHMKNQYHPRRGVVLIPFIKGIIITLWGILAILLSKVEMSSLFLIKSFGILNIIASVLTFIFAMKYYFLKITGQWMLLEFGTELLAGILITFWVTTPALFMQYISIGIFFIVILQFIYGYALLNTGEYNLWNLLMRFVTLFSGTIIGVALFTPIISFSTALIVIGFFSIIYGIIHLQFSYQMKNAVLGTMK